MEDKEAHWHLGYPSPRRPPRYPPLSLAPLGTFSLASRHLGGCAARQAGLAGRRHLLRRTRVPLAGLSARGALRTLGPRGGAGGGRSALSAAWCRAVFIPAP